MELCGGTHVARTGDIGLISIVSEAAVAAGVRRIEAKTAEAARHHLNAEARRLRDLAGLLKTSAEEAPDRLASLIEERRKLERDLAEAKKKLAMGGGATGTAGTIVEIAGVKFFRLAVRGVEMKDLKSLADEGKAKVGSGVVAIANTAADGKAGLVVGVTGDLAATLQCRRSGAGRGRAIGRQGRRRPSRHGAGRRAGRLEDRSRARRHRRPARRQGGGRMKPAADAGPMHWRRRIHFVRTSCHLVRAFSMILY